MRIIVPELSLVVLVGPSGCGKSTFARRHFDSFEVLSSDAFRGLVANDEADQSASRDAFAVLHDVAGRRLRRGLLTVVDATNVQPHARRALVDLARRHHLPAIALVLDLPEELCQDRNRARSQRRVDPAVISQQIADLRASASQLAGEGFARVMVIDDPAALEAAFIERERAPIDLRHLHGPFDIIGDVHGCVDELRALLGELGYAVAGTVEPPAGRTAVFLGDLVDRGPDSPGVLRIVMSMVDAGSALCVGGNHDAKLLKALRGRSVQRKHGLAETLEQLSREPPDFRVEVAEFLERLVSHWLLDDRRLVVAHGGMKEELQGRDSKRVRSFALYGDTTGEVDELGLPVRLDWARHYRGRAKVVYGHTPVLEPQWLNNTINIDTGCVFGGRLTALRYPELTLVSVRARRRYATRVSAVSDPHTRSHPV